MLRITELIQVESPRLANAEEIRQLDPLGMNALFADSTISSLNERQDVNGLVSILQAILPTSERIAQFSTEEIHAAARDIGILVGSIARHIDPFSCITELEWRYTLLTDRRGMSPYHTVFDYGLWNPGGIYRRRFTDTEQEREFIASVEAGMISLNGCLERVYPLFTNPSVSQAEIDEVLAEVRELFLPLVQAIPAVMRNVGAEFFAYHMRPFFNSIRLHGESLEAPGGAQMPLILLDHMLWGSDLEDERYNAFRERNLRYLPAEMAEFVRRTIGMPSLVTRYLAQGLPQEGSEGLYKLLATLVSFRKPHEKLARDSFHHRAESALGSGGYDPDILTHLAQLTYQQMALLRN